MRKYLQIKPTTLSYSISGAQTSLRFQGLKKLDGTSISASDIGDYVTGTLGPGTSREEIISFGSSDITINSDGTVDAVNVVRGLEEIDDYSTGGFSSEHGAGEVFVISNNPQLYKQLLNRHNDETVSGSYTFSASPIVPTPVNPTEAVTKAYADGLAIAGSPDAGVALKGISKTSVAPASATNPIVVGDNDPRVAPNNHATSTGSSNAYVVTLTNVPAALVKGQVYSFLSNFANTSAATVNINSLGAKTIKKAGGATDLASGDIASGMIVELIYDGTNMIMVNPSALSLNSNGDGSSLTGIKLGFAKNGSTSASTSTTQTITIGFQARAIRATTMAGSSSNISWSVGSWDVTTAGSTCGGFGNNGVVYVTAQSALGYTQSGGATDSMTFQVSNVTATSFDLVSTKVGTQSATIVWEAIA